MCKFGGVKEVSVLRQDQPAKVDTCLAPLVYLLNQFGIETITSCCGHGKVAKSSIRISAQNIKFYKVDEDYSIHLEFPYQRENK